MEQISTGLIGAVAGAALLAALAFRHLVGTVIQLNQELQNALDERRKSDEARQLLSDRVEELEFQIASLKSRLEEQAVELGALRSQLYQRDHQIAALQIQLERP